MLENRWLALAVIFIVRFALGFQFQSAGSIAPFLVRDFGIDFVQVGTLVGLYLLPGAFIAIPGGFFGRRFGDKRVVVGAIILMIVGGVLSGAAETYWFVMSGRLLSGIGASFVIVLASKMIADWFAEKELVLAMSIYIIGWPMGIAAGQAVQAGIAQIHSWNFVFYLTSAILAVTLAAMVLVYRSPRTASQPSQIMHRLSQREFWMVCVAGAIWMLVNASYLVVLTFGPTLLTERGISLVDASFTVSLMSWASLAAILLGAYLATRYRIPDLSMILGLLGSIIAAVLIPVSSGTSNLFFVLFGVALGLSMPVVSSLPAQLLAPQNRALGFGIYFVWFYAGTPFLTAGGGWLKDRFTTAQFSFFYAAAMIALSLVLILFIRYQESKFSRHSYAREKAASV
jgi:predicted MFS family arabinose efflux permease